MLQSFRAKKLLDIRHSRFLIVLLTLVVLFSACSMPDDDISLTDLEQQAAVGLVRAALADQPYSAKDLPGKLTEEFRREVFITVYQDDGEFIESAFLGDNLAASLIGAVERLRQNKKFSRYQAGDKPIALEIEVLASVGKLLSPHPKLLPRLIDRGIHGLIKVNGGKARYLRPSLIVNRGYAPAKTVSLLDRDRGVALDVGQEYDDGYYRYRVFSFAQADAEAEVAALYRGNYLLPEISSQAIMEACKLGADCLIAMQRPEGRFDYEYYPDRDSAFISKKAEKKDLYNYLRHAGTTYSLFQTYKETGIERFRISAEEACDWMIKQIDYSPDGSFAYPHYNGRVKLGGAGLALIALVERVRATGAHDQDKLMEKLADFILHQQREDGSFKGYYSPDPTRKAKSRVSIYYPGEAILALTRLYYLDQNDRWLQAAIKGSDYLVHDRWNLLGIDIAVPPDAWLMLALSDLYRYAPDQAYAEYCFRIGENMIRDQMREEDTKFADHVGGYVPRPPSVTPAGARMEGLTAAYYLRKQLKMDNSEWLKVIEYGCRFQINCQIRPQTAFMFPNSRRALGVFRDSVGRNMVRIDYNQHNMSSLLVAARILKEHGK